MKFLCPSCKAKYQIGDEKVAGRSVRMKCRKCGYVIQVSSVPGLGDALPGSEPPPPVSEVSASTAVPPLDRMPLEFESIPAPAVGTPAAPAAKSAPSAAGAPPSTRSAPVAQRPEVKKIPVPGVTRPTAPKPAVTSTSPKVPAALAPKAPPP